MKMKNLMGVSVFGLVALVFATTTAANIGCGAADLCPSGEVPCGSGCMPYGSICCGDGAYCPSGYVCGPNNTCLNPNVVSGCAANGEETCYNTDGTSDCAPLGASCCGNHHFCPVGTVCLNGGTSCGQ